MSLKTIKCPHCGYVYRTYLEAVADDGQTTAVRSTDESIPMPVAEIKIDLTCPSCGKVFVWPVK